MLFLGVYYTSDYVPIVNYDLYFCKETNFKGTSQMKFIAPRALTSLTMILAALGATTHAWADSHADVAATVSKANSYYSAMQSIGNFTSTEIQFFESQLDVVAYNQADAAGKVAYVQQLVANAKAYIKEMDEKEPKPSPSFEYDKYSEAQDIVKYFAKPEDVPARYQQLQRYAELDTLEQNAGMDVVFRIYSNPALETERQLRTLNLINAHHQLNLLHSFGTTPAQGAFTHAVGTWVNGAGASGSSQQLVAGYKYALPSLPVASQAHLAGWGQVSLHGTSTNNISTNKFSPSYGLGGYADYTWSDVRLALLGSLAQGQVTLHNSADFRPQVSQLLKPSKATYFQQLANYAVTGNAQLRNYDAIVKVDYRYVPFEQLTLVPGLVYQYQRLQPDNPQAQVVNGSADFVTGFTTVNHYQPLFATQVAHRWGATLAANYQLSSELGIGGDVALVYSNEQLGKRINYTVVEGQFMPQFSSQAHTSSSVALSLNAQATYQFLPQAELGLQMGFVHLSDVQQTGFTTGAHLQYRF